MAENPTRVAQQDPESPYTEGLRSWACCRPEKHGGTGVQKNPRLHVTGVQNTDPYVKHAPALEAIGRQVFELDFSCQQAFWNHERRPAPASAPAIDEPRMG